MTTMPDIPEQLKWYTPLRLDAYSGVFAIWRVTVDEMTGNIEIKRAPLIKLSSVLLGIALGVIVWGGFFFVGEGDFILDLEELIIGLVFFSLLIICVIVPLDAFCTTANSRHWKGPLRFRFASTNGELFFPREDVTYYGRENYSKIVLGCIRGVDMKGAFKMGIAWVKLGRKRSNSFEETTQIFMLVLDQNGEWKRYNLADDTVRWRSKESGSKQFVQFADLLRQHLSFEQFVKDYSLDECYEQQRR